MVGHGEDSGTILDSHRGCMYHGFMTVTTYYTDSSKWIVDEGAMIVTRVPRTEDPSHESCSYDLLGAPAEFEWVRKVVWFEIPRIQLLLSNGHVITSGEIFEEVK